MASSASVNELIWHFAGYLKVSPADNFAIKVMFDGGGNGALPALEDLGASAHPHALPGLEGLPGVTLGLATLPSPNPYLWRISPIHKWPSSPHQDPDHSHSAPRLPGLPPPPANVDPDVAVGDNFQITVTYQGGGDQELIDIRQINVMINNNQVNAPADVVAANEAHADHLLASMLEKAQDALPLGPDLTAADTTQLKAFVDAADSHPLLTQAHDAPYAFQPGQYVNGMPVTDGSDPHQVTNDLFNTVSESANNAITGPPMPPSGDHAADSIQHVSVGSNVAANDAVLVNLEGLSVSLAVLGNYYHTEAIVQTNVFKGVDHFTGSGATSVAPNTVDNIADVQNQIPSLTSDGSATVAPSGLNWSVDVLHSDLLNVHSLIQTNYLSNNNVVFQTSSTGESDIVAGGNTLSNAAQFQNLTSNYDLIVVEGSYHQDDLISQQNILLDSNTVDFEGPGSAVQSATGGGNSLVNDASIVDTGNHNSTPLNADAVATIQGLEGEAATLDPNALANAFPSLMGNIHALVVTGDYYDINYVSQTNVMSNSNVVALNGSAAAPAGATQSVSTGHDVTVNSATIVDGGSIQSPYLQGNYYNDMILIQTNIIGDDTKNAGHDHNHFVPELVAFTSALDAADHHDQHTSVVASTDPHHHNDGVASILH